MIIISPPLVLCLPPLPSGAFFYRGSTTMTALSSPATSTTSAASRPFSVRQPIPNSWTDDSSVVNDSPATAQQSRSSTVTPIHNRVERSTNQHTSAAGSRSVGGGGRSSRGSAGDANGSSGGMSGAPSVHTSRSSWIDGESTRDDGDALSATMSRTGSNLTVEAEAAAVSTLSLFPDAPHVPQAPVRVGRTNEVSRGNHGGVSGGATTVTVEAPSLGDLKGTLGSSPERRGRADRVSSSGLGKIPTNGAHPRAESEQRGDMESMTPAGGGSRGGASTSPLRDFSRTAPPSVLPQQSTQAPGSPRGSTPSFGSVAGTPSMTGTPKDALTIGVAAPGSSGVSDRGGGSGSREKLPGTPMSSGLMAMKTRLIRRWNSPRFIQQTSLTPASGTPGSSYFGGTSASPDGGPGSRPLGSDGSTSTAASRTPSRKGSAGSKWRPRRVRDPPEPSSAPPPPPSFWTDGGKSGGGGGSGGSRDRAKGSSSGGCSHGSRTGNTPGENGCRSSDSLKLATPSWLKSGVRTPSSTSKTTSVVSVASVGSPLRLSDYERLTAGTKKAKKSVGGGGGGGNGLETSASSKVFLSGSELEARRTADHPLPMYSTAADTNSANSTAVAGEVVRGSANWLGSGSGGASAGTNHGAAAVAVTSVGGTTDPEVLDRALTGPAVAGPRPGSGKWPGIAVPGPATGDSGGRVGGTKAAAIKRSNPLLASSGSWAEAPDDLALTKKFRVSLMFYTKVMTFWGGRGKTRGLI